METVFEDVGPQTAAGSTQKYPKSPTFPLLLTGLALLGMEACQAFFVAVVVGQLAEFTLVLNH
jgi:hypothetical protein